MSLITPPMQIFTYVLLMILVFMLSRTNANAFNESLEAKALFETHWWDRWGYKNALDDHCNWFGVKCNKAESVISISIVFDSGDLIGIGYLGSLDFSSVPNLERLSIENSYLEGSIPEQIGLLSNLTHLSLHNNRLTGKLPDSLTGLIRLEYLDLSSNNFSGKFHVPFNNFTRIQHLDLSSNMFTGVLPTQIGSLKNLIVLDLSWNQFSGPILSSFGSMVNLKVLDLSTNRLNESIPKEISNLQKLEYVDLGDNNLDGHIPPSLGLLSSLAHLSVRGNRFRGMLPVSLTNLSRLVYLYLGHNKFTGPIPSSLTSMVNLEILDLSTNQLNASIPKEINNLQKLKILNLGDNNLDGHIPSSFGNLSQLKLLDLGLNNISGPVPQVITNLRKLEYVDLNHNSLMGPLHTDFRNFSRLSYLDFSSNQLSGNISKFRLPCNLEHIDLSINHLFGAFTGLLICNDKEYLDHRTNILVGEIYYITNFPHLYYLNLSHNHLTHNCSGTYTEIGFPCSILTGEPISKGQRRNKLFLYLDIFLPIISGFCLIAIVYVLYCRQKSIRKKIQPETKKHGDVCSILNYDGTVAYEDFIAATEDFDLKYCIGTGGYGSVYEAKLPNGKTFALKKLHRYEANQPAFDQSFKNEVQVLTNLRHKIIVKLYGFCLHNKCNFIVYEYMEKGSLFCALSNNEFAVQLDWMKRVKIIKDVAHALAYMHHDCSPTIIHRDISSNCRKVNNKIV